MEEQKKSELNLLKKLQVLRKRMVGIERIRIGHKRTQDALYESVELYQTLIETSPDAITLTDLSGRVIMVNRAKIIMHGYDKADELLGRDVFEFFAPQERDRARKDMERIYKEKIVRTVEYTLLKKDGTFFYADISAGVVMDKQGHPEAFIGMTRDITARKKAEEQLLKNEKLFRATIEATEDGILVVDNEGRVTHYNARFAKMWKIPGDILKTNDDNTLLEFVLDQLEYPQEFTDKVRQLYASSRESLDTLLFKDQRVFERFSCPLKEGRKVVGRVWSFRDITGRKQSENILQRSEERFRSAAENAGTWVWEVNPQGLYTYCNSVVQNILGYKQEELLGKKHCYELFAPDEREELTKIIFEKFARKETCAGFVHNKVSKDGKIVVVEAKCAPILDEKGELLGYRGSDVNVTEQVKAAEQIEDSQRMLSTLMSNLPGMVYRCKDDETWTVEFISDGCFELTGYSSADITNSAKVPFAQIIHADDRQKVLADVKNALEIKQEFKLTYRILTAGGKEKWVNNYGKGIFSSNGAIIALEGVITDISHYKHLEEDRERLNAELLKANEKLKQLVLIDPHTGLYNHRYFQEAIEAEFVRAKRQHSPLALIMVDLDYFKSINDVYGHEFGDVILHQIAIQLKQMVRKYDTLIRYGGEEFIIIAPGMGRDLAFILAQRLLETLRLQHFGDEEHSVKVKLSMAVVAFPEDKLIKGMDFISAAEAVLSLAKERGGDRVCSSIDMDQKQPASQSKEEIEDVEFLQEKLDKLTKQANESLAEAIFAFAKTIEMKDHYTGEHVEKTVHYATAIARNIGLSKNEIERIRQATILHDLGKIGISEKILMKNSQLTKSEYEEIKSHPQIGVDILRPIHFFHGILPLILHHHERWDGKGYPYGLKKEEIPVAARIIAIADTYEALTSDRCYRKACSIEIAAKVIQDNANTQFDPNLVKVFMDILEKEKQ
ncbi:MAG: PAS domain S-box protein [Candidatus Omnitrophota bacterium]